MLVLPSVVSLAEARDTLAMLLQALPREPAAQLVVDASGLQRFDSSVLSVLLECRRSAQASGRGFAVRDASPRLLQLARLHGVEPLFDADDLAAAAGGRTSAASTAV